MDNCTGPPLQLQPSSITLNVEHILNESFSFNFNWSEPFTWPGFPITSYTTTITSYRSGQPIVHNTTIIHGNGLGAIRPDFQFSSGGNDCYQLQFSVKANNSLGQSQPTYLTFGHPITGNLIAVHADSQSILLLNSE